MGTTRNVEAIYPLTPVQEGMLFHALDTAEAGVYFRQSTWELPPDTDPERLREAWRRVVARHPVLRTSFVWRGFERPLQVVRRSIEVPWAEEDWRHLEPAEAVARLDRFLEDDRREGFDLERGPLLRLTRIRLDGGERLMWSHLQLLLDGWSRGLVLNEVVRTYEALLRGVEPDLPPVPPFREYVAWLESRKGEEADAFWRALLAGFDAPTPVPLARPSALPGPPRPRDARRRLSRAHSDRLVRAARERGLTLNTLVLGAWLVLLARTTGRRDVLSGITDSGRSPELSGVDRMVGLFISTLPLRIRVSPNALLVHWLRDLQELHAGMRQYGHVPLVRLQEWSDVPPGHPLMEVLYVFENYPVEAEGNGGDGVRTVQSFARTHYPVNLLVTPEERLSLVCRHDGRRLDRGRAEQLLDHLATLLEALPDHLDSPLGELPWLSPAQRHQVLVEISGAARPVPSPDRLLHEGVTRQAARRPAAVAVRSGEDVLDYGELDRRSRLLAGHLRRLGVAPEDRVGVCLEPGLDLAPAYLAVLKAAGILVPLDPSHPRERLRYLVKDAGIDVVLTSSNVDLPTGLRRVDLDRLAAEDLDGYAGATVALDPDGAAYVIYTSGSTGRPKGVVVSHRAVVNRITWAQSAYPLSPEDVVLQSASLSFDFSIWELFGAWFAGASCLLVPSAERGDVAALLRRVREEGVTVAHFVPSLLRLYLEQPGCEAGPSLARVFCGGEVLDPALRDLALERLPGVELYNQYGPTEATIDATWHRCRSGERGGPVPIGRPIDGIRTLVLDGFLDPLPEGAIGELYLAGAGLARGYLGCPAATAEGFVPDPWGSPGSRLYRTGDLVRWTSFGRLLFQGRRDDQVQLRGVRVELGEVEAALASAPAVVASVATVRGEGEERRLVAFLVLEQGAPPDALATVRRHLEKRLPAYMVPSSLVPLDELLRSASGKVDRRALASLDVEGRSPSGRPPRGTLEELIAGIWQEVLGRKRVGAEESFFEIGGHSLLATRVLSRLHRHLDIDLPLGELFEAPTVAGLATAVERRLAGERERSSPPLEPTDRSGGLPLSFAQERLWFLDRLEPGSATYNLPGVLRLDGGLDLCALAAGLGWVEDRHEVLRTVYREREGRPVQVVLPAAARRLPVVDLESLDEGRRRSEGRRLRQSEARRPFDLAGGPVWRRWVLRLGPELHELLVTFHHIATDAWSTAVLGQEVAELYTAAVSGRPHRLAPLPIQYGDFAAWQRHLLSGERLAEEVDHWRQRLAGAPPVLELPTDRSRPAVQSYRGATVRWVLPAPWGNRLAAAARQRGATPFMLLLAAFQVLLARYSGSADISVGTPVAGRRRVELEPLIGFFVNTLVLRVDLSDSPAFDDVVVRVRQFTLDALAHQEVPFERLVGELAPQRTLAYSPLFQVMFALQNAPRLENALPGLSTSMHPVDSGASKFDLNLSVAEEGEALVGSLTYAADLFDATTAERLLQHLGGLLEAALERPSDPVDVLPWMTRPQWHQVVTEWSGQGTVVPEPPTLWECFAAQATRTPDAEALYWRSPEGREVRLTYRELHQRATGFAGHLARRGAGPEVRVGVLLERRPEMVVALLGILGAGGAYVPLDPAYPRSRVELMLEDGGVEVLVGEAGLLEGLERVPAVVRVEPGEGLPVESGPVRPASSDNLAYVIYTSGSTGRPKGVAISHRSAGSLVSWALRDFQPRELRHTLASTSICFDLSVFELFVPLSQGTRVVLVRDALALAELPPDVGVTLVNTVPSAMSELLRNGGVPASVVTVNLAGEPLRGSLVEGLYDLGTVESVCNLYGPSEDTTYSTWCRVSEGGGEPTIGQPVDGGRAYVLDRRGQPVPVGVAGEVYLGGVGLARGYLSRPGATAGRWVPDPFGQQPGGRLYRTGDRACWRGDGSLQYLGRLDHQVKVRGFRIELGEVEVALQRHPAVEEAVVVVHRDGDRSVLAAYVASDGEPPSVGELRDLLAESLPGHMIPSWFVVLDDLPRTPNGKVDRKALPAPDSQRNEVEGEWVAPRTEVEVALAAVWSQVLGVERPGVHDNFFELGGDSILSMQVVSRARGAGWRLTPRQVFQHPTVAELAQVVRPVREVAAEQGPVTGPIPLAPMQRRYLRQAPRVPHHYNQAVLLAPRDGAKPTALAMALDRVLRHHDALRTRFRRGADGSWIAVLVPPGGARPPLTHVDLTALPVDLRTAAAAVAAEGAQRSLHLERGPLFRALWLEGERSDGRPGHLLLVVHHLVVDGVSWRILLEDLGREYGRSAASRPPTLPLKTTSFRTWTQRLVEWVGSGGLDPEADFWEAFLRDAVPDLPVDHPGGDNTRASVGTVVGRLEPEETAALLREVPAAYRGGVEDALLAALLLTVTAWTGRQDLLVDLEGHGREELFGDLDPGRTVGWFTSLYPVRLVRPGSMDPGEALKTVKETLRTVPRRGVGFGLLTELGNERAAARRLARLPSPQVIFNYLGRLDRAVDEDGPFAPAAGPRGETVDPRERRPHLLDVTARVVEDRLEVSWRYSRGLHRPETLEALCTSFLAELRRLVEHCRKPSSAGYTPSDFPLAGLSQEALDRLFGGDRGIEDVYPLAPVQVGMLLHALETQGSGTFVEQVVRRLRGDLDEARLAAAWQHLLDRHPVLRTAFGWEDLEEPRQIVRRPGLRLPVLTLDWREKPDLEERFAAFLDEDRHQGFDLSLAPLVRVALIRCGDREVRLVWTSHHLVTDGWSVALLLQELVTLYEARGVEGGSPLPPTRPYSVFLAWLAEQDPVAAESYWRQELAGFCRPTPLPFALPGEVVEGDRPYADHRWQLDGKRTAALLATARRHRVTPGVLVQAVWALVLAQGEDRDVVFGATVSGRPAAVPGVERIVGPFINTVPVRVQVPAAGSVDVWLRDLQARHAERQQYEHSGLIQRWSEVPLGLPLFESLLVYQGFAGRDLGRTEGDGPGLGGDGTLEVESLGHTVRTRHPLSLVVVPGRQMRFQLTYDRRRVGRSAALRLLHQLGRLMDTMAGEAVPRVEHLSPLGPGERHQVLHEWPRFAAYRQEREAWSGESAEGSAAALRPRVVDGGGRSVPPELIGELCLAGTDGPEPGRRTGRAARFREDGRLEVLGTLGESWSLFGRSLYPRELAVIVERHPAVDRCMVLRDGDGAVRCRVETVPGRDLSADELIDFAARRLPPFLAPRHWEVDGLAAGPATGERERDGELLDIVLGLWKEVLGVEELTVDDDFLALGGNSLLAVQLVTRLRDALGVELPLRILFAAPTVAGLLPGLRSAMGLERNEPPLVPSASGGGAGALSFAQQRLWFLDQLEPGNPAYNIPMALALEGELSIPCLEQAVAEVVRRHRILRTTFAGNGGGEAARGEPVQWVGPATPEPIPGVDLRLLPEPTRRRYVDELAVREARRSFDLSAGPLLRTTLLRLDRTRHVLLVTIHHIVSDGWSMGILVSEVNQLYRFFIEGRPSRLAPLPIHYADYSQWQRRWMSGERLEGLLAYWRDQLQGHREQLHLPTAEGAAGGDRAGDQQILPLPADLSSRISAFARREGATPFMVLLTAFALLLRSYGNPREVTVGMPIANRNRRETEGLVGFFINVLPLRVDLADSPSGRGLLHRVREICLGALAHQDLPLEKLVEALPSRGEGRLPFRVTFGVQNAPTSHFDLPDLRVSRHEIGRQTVRFDLTVWVSETPQGLRVVWTWARNLMDEATVRAMHERFTALLDRLVAEPDREIDRLAAAALRVGDDDQRRQTDRRRKLLSVRPHSIKVESSS